MYCLYCYENQYSDTLVYLLDLIRVVVITFCKNKTVKNLKSVQMIVSCYSEKYFFKTFCWCSLFEIRRKKGRIGARSITMYKKPRQQCWQMNNEYIQCTFIFWRLNLIINKCHKKNWNSMFLIILRLNN